jgi:hypothetical protein
MKMEFRLVGDISREEIMDYALVSGDHARNLVIQTLLNFNHQKFPATRLVTIICDTMSCFLGIGNQSALTDYPLVKGL